MQPKNPRRVADHLRLVTVPGELNGLAPQWNQEAERWVLYGALTRRETLTRLLARGMKPEHFFPDDHARIWEAMAALAEVPGAVVQAISVAQWVRDRRQSGRPTNFPGEFPTWEAFLEAIEHVGPSQWTMTQHGRREAVIDYHATMVLELFEVRAVVAVADHLAAEGRNPILDRRTWIDNAATRIAACSLGGAPHVEEAGEILLRLYAELDVAADAGALAGYSCGLANVDRIIGGLMPAETMLLTGREKEGKSALGAQWCASVARRPMAVSTPDPSCSQCRDKPCERHAWQWFGALILQWEDPKEKTLQRLIGARARVNLSRIRTGAWDEYDRRSFVRAGDEFAHLPLKIEDACAPDVATIAAKVRAVRDEFAARGIILGTVMIDSLQALVEQGRTREEEIDKAMKKLMALKRADDLQRVSWIVINHTGEDGQMVNAKGAPRRWCNVWLDLRVSTKDKENGDGGRPAYLEVKVARDFEAGQSIPLWCYRGFNNLFLDG